MPIPNISTLYQRIKKGAEGGHEFARFMKLLLGTDYSNRGIHFISESDATGDFKKLDAYFINQKWSTKLLTGFQFKFYPETLNKQQRYEIIKSIEAALAENNLLEQYILITPEDWHKEDQDWFDKLRQKYERPIVIECLEGTLRSNFNLLHWGHSKIIELSLKHEHIGRLYFKELYPLEVGKLKLTKCSIDTTLCNWAQSSHGKNIYYGTTPLGESIKKTSNPILDFQFKNSTPEIMLLDKIEIHIEKIWTTLKGLPTEIFLNSSGTIEHEMDFSKPINVISFHNPLVLKPISPLRFKVSLNGFLEKCPGNWSTIKFWFHFDEATIVSDSFVLSL